MLSSGFPGFSRRKPVGEPDDAFHESGFTWENIVARFVISTFQGTLAEREFEKFESNVGLPTLSELSENSRRDSLGQATD